MLETGYTEQNNTTKRRSEFTYNLSELFTLGLKSLSIVLKL
ncbi:hypothetical protein CLRAG_27930 [Clostridium ragsdalei P11]|uniref:Uncharacterized protein n=1 Tax=Clostridium ragsdalei P11 TaxID=1353534 RepID=A0A1A6AP15_9CLOT|nr:hypothetical protein CLRAG_27930 [Clostridium ragsdalei P11]